MSLAKEVKGFCEDVLSSNEYKKLMMRNGKLAQKHQNHPVLGPSYYKRALYYSDKWQRALKDETDKQNAREREAS